MASDDDDDPTRNFHRGNRQSKQAFNDTPGKVRTRQRMIIAEFVRKRGAHGATSEEAETILKMRHQTCSARFTDLKKAGVLIESERRRRTSSGRWAAVCVHSKCA